MVFYSEIILLSSKPRPHEQRRTLRLKRLTTVTEANGTTTHQDSTELNPYVLAEDYKPMEVFQAVDEITYAAELLGLTSGPKLFNTFQALVQGSSVARYEWQVQTDAVGQRSVPNFTVALQAFLRAMLPDLKYASQLDYMRNLTKPGPLSVNDFRRDLKILNNLVAKFPDANGGTGLSDDEFKRVFFHAMPKFWRTSFEDAGYREHTSTIEHIADYMKLMEQHHPYEARPARNTTNITANSTNASSTGAHQNSRQNNNNSRGNQNSSNNESTPPTNSNQANNRNGSTNNNNRPRPEDICPLSGHQGHTWYNCYRNPHGRHGTNTERPTNLTNSNGTGTDNHNRSYNAESNTINAAESHYHDLSNIEDDYLDQVDDLDTELYFFELLKDSNKDSIPSLMKPFTQIL